MRSQKKVRLEIMDALRLQRLHIRSIKFQYSMIDHYSTQIDRLEDELYWLNLIEYCNTPCWRFRL